MDKCEHKNVTENNNLYFLQTYSFLNKNTDWYNENILNQVVILDNQQSVVIYVHKYVSQKSICELTDKYKPYLIIWIILSTYEVISLIGQNINNKIQFNSNYWIYENFRNYNCIFIAFPNNIIARINPNDVINNAIETDNIYYIDNFIKSIEDNTLWKTYIMNNDEIKYNNSCKINEKYEKYNLQRYIKKNKNTQILKESDPQYNLINSLYIKRLNSKNITNNYNEKKIWRNTLLSYYPITNIYLRKIHKNQRKGLRFDILLNDNHIIELCDSYIQIDYINYKAINCKQYSINIIWLILCFNSSLTLTYENNNKYKVFFKKKYWKYKNFINYNYIFLSINDYILRINPNEVKDNCVYTDNVYNKDEFINATNNDFKKWKIDIMKNEDIVHDFKDTEELLNKRIYNTNTLGHASNIFKKRCSTSFISKYTFIKNKPVHINNILKKNGKTLCYYGHELTINNDKTYFIHKNKNDTDGLKKSNWHETWSSNFPYTEILYKKVLLLQKTNRFSDITLKNTNFVVEVQHSYISLYEVSSRIIDYKLHNKEILWIMDCSDIQLEKISETEYCLTFTKKEWIYNKFLTYNYIFLDINSKIARITPKNVIGNKIIISELYDINKFIFSLKHNYNLWKNIDELTYIIDGQFFPPLVNIYSQRLKLKNKLTFSINQLNKYKIKKYCKTIGGKYPKTDIVQSTFIIKYQSKPLCFKQVKHKIKKYGKNILWIINCFNIPKYISKYNNKKYILSFSSHKWILHAFYSYNFIICDLGLYIAKIVPKNHVNYLIDVIQLFDRNKFIHSLMYNVNLWPDIDKIMYEPDGFYYSPYKKNNTKNPSVNKYLLYENIVSEIILKKEQEKKYIITSKRKIRAPAEIIIIP